MPVVGAAMVLCVAKQQHSSSASAQCGIHEHRRLKSSSSVISTGGAAAGKEGAEGGWLPGRG